MENILGALLFDFLKLQSRDCRMTTLALFKDVLAPECTQINICINICHPVFEVLVYIKQIYTIKL